MSNLVDRSARQRFACELNRNFSVVASAGSGKTRAITDRVVEIARSRQALEWLPQLVVVTYTNRAADEMQQRTRQQILKDAKLSKNPAVLEAFNRAFFGTIHSFCMKLLAAYGHHLGLPQNLELITDDSDLWNEFAEQYTRIGRSLSHENRRVLLRHVQARQLMELGRSADFDFQTVQPEIPFPKADFAPVYAANEKPSQNIARAKTDLNRWEKRWRDTGEFVPWPVCATTSREFVRIWREAFRPLRDWITVCVRCVAAEVQRDYREFRLERGLVTYADQVTLAGELMRGPDAAQQIREKNYRVILDEAQDTDPQQFFVLLEIARSPEASNVIPSEVEESRDRIHWLRSGAIRPGHFCMVGDFQQSIYRDPADLAHYRQLHEALVEAGAAEELKFSVTFRLDMTQLDFVNATFREILNNQDGQVEFVKLSPRPEILPGQVIRLDFGCDVDLALPEAQRASLEARELAVWLYDTRLEKLRAESWRQVAILCPRKAWLRLLREALVKVALPVEVHSETDREGESPAYAWLTALLAIMADPNATYEIVGVLREIFGLSDDELHRFSEGYGARFQIAERTAGRGLAADTLNRLVRLREAIAQQPLFSAVQEIVRATELRERLRSLPVDEFGNLDNDLDKLLGAVATAEARGFSLPDVEQRLRMKFHATRETNPSPRDAIQLITAHKAKGSEWQAVIVPFLTREVRDAPPRYPYAIRSVNRAGAQIVFDRTDFDECKEELKKIERQEMERLLYVALTRAKHTLVLAFDRQFFLNSRGQFHNSSQIKWLRAGDAECNSEVVTKLSTEARECIETREGQRSVSGARVKENLGKRELGWLDDARQRAARFVRTMRPSKSILEEETQPRESADVWIEIEPELRSPRIDNPATRYGVWWHQFIQQIPWGRDAASWDAVFEAAQANSPDVARSKREWRRLRGRISSVSDFPLRFTNGAPIAHAEMPFFWRMNGNQCMEGIIDLALFELGEKRWFILDWKTNQIAQNKIGVLRAQYLPQMAAYWKAVSEMTPNVSRGDVGIYSTATGQFIIYNPADLAAEWERLRNLPANDLAVEIADSR